MLCSDRFTRYGRNTRHIGDDRKRTHRRDFKDLYYQSWRVEETFKHLKSQLEVENFQGSHPWLYSITFMLMDVVSEKA